MNDKEIEKIEEVEPFDEQVEGFFTLMQEFTEGQRAFNARILVDLDTIKKALKIIIEEGTKKKSHFKHVEGTDKLTRRRGLTLPDGACSALYVDASAHSGCVLRSEDARHSHF